MAKMRAASMSWLKPRYMRTWRFHIRLKVVSYLAKSETDAGKVDVVVCGLL